MPINSLGPTNISGVILAGGQGSRMNNEDKGLVELRHTPLVEHVIHRLESQVDDLVISANRNIDKYAAYGHKVTKDTIDGSGPLTGIYSAAAKCKHDVLFVTACDMPFLPLDVVAKLAMHFNGSATAAFSNGRIEPLACLVSRASVAKIEGLLLGEDYSVMRWLKSCDLATTVHETFAPDAFSNINSSQELARIDREQNR